MPAETQPPTVELIIEDETIEETELNFDVQPLTSADGYPGVGAPFIPPRPITEVIPEYPREDFKNGITGVVKLHVKVNERGKVIDVVVLENTTGSERCAAAARKAAFRGSYLPARQGSKPITTWTVRIITFDLPR